MQKKTHTDNKIIKHNKTLLKTPLYICIVALCVAAASRPSRGISTSGVRSPDRPMPQSDPGSDTS